MPPELEPYIPFVITAVIALFFGWLFTWLAAGATKSALNERLKSEERRVTDSEARLAAATAESERNEAEAQSYRNQLSETKSRLEAERKAAEENKPCSSVLRQNSPTPSKPSQPMLSKAPPSNSSTSRNPPSLPRQKKPKARSRNARPPSRPW
jgi:hypothetical protein